MIDDFGMQIQCTTHSHSHCNNQSIFLFHILHMRVDIAMSSSFFKSCMLLCHHQLGALDLMNKFVCFTGILAVTYVCKGYEQKRH